MILIDLTSYAVTVEGDGDVDHLITVRTLQTDGSSSAVWRYREDEPVGATDGIEETVRSRAGRHVMREYDIDRYGVYALVSGRREMEQNRAFYIRVTFDDVETMRIAVLPGSSACSWVVEDELHHYERGETLQFSVRVSRSGVAVADGELTRIESDRSGVKYERSTAWDRILEDDDVDSV
jgi:2-polyprenyl-6-methoxyphenol hydroxylase-like FAD-dependent oxidoreductase